MTFKAGNLLLGILVILMAAVVMGCGEPAEKSAKSDPASASVVPKVDISSEDWTTYFERSGETETPRYDETVEYCRRLAEASDKVEFTTFGKSPRGRDLPLLVIDSAGNFTPEAVRASGKAVVLVEGAIHAGESAGKDAGLMLARDLTVAGKLDMLLDNVTLLFVPIFNVDGHERFGPYNRINQNGPKEMGWRTNARNLNLNRDFLKADTEEMKAWLELFQKWLPDFFIDTHSTDGADYQYHLTYGLETNGNMDSDLTAYTKEYVAALTPKMQAAGFLISPYVMFKDWHDPRSGLRSGAAGPRYSTGYTAVQNRPGLLVETHMLKDYSVRVHSTYQILRLTLEYIGATRNKLLALNAQADRYVASSEFRKKDFPLRFENTEKSTGVEFLGVEYEAVKSDLTGGTWFKYSDTPAIFEVQRYYEVIPSKSVRLPEAYVVPPEWSD